MLFKYIRPPFPGQVCNILRSCTATYIAAESFVCWNGSRHQKHRGTRFQGQSPTSKKETNGNKIIIIQDKILFIWTQPRACISLIDINLHDASNNVLKHWQSVWVQISNSSCTPIFWTQICYSEKQYFQSCPSL